MTDRLDELIRMKVEAAGAPAEASDLLAMLLRSRLDVRPDGTIKVLDAAGNTRIGSGPAYADMSFDEAILELAAAKPTIFGRAKAEAVAETKPVAKPDGETVTERVAREHRDAKTARSAAESNPWHPASRNKTLQVLIEHRDPKRAARLKAAAGVK